MKTLIILFVLIAVSLAGYSQDLPAGTCGIVFTYDAAGNRVKRVYECKGDAKIAYLQDYPGNEVAVEAMYPNPTTGNVTIRLAKELQNAHVTIYNGDGRALYNRTGTNTNWTIDLSTYADGIYYIELKGEGRKIVKRVVKVSGSH